MDVPNPCKIAVFSEGASPLFSTMAVFNFCSDNVAISQNNAQKQYAWKVNILQILS